MSTVIYPTYPPSLYLLAPFSAIQQPYLIILYFEWFSGLLLSEHLVKINYINKNVFCKMVWKLDLQTISQ